jgi:hypothetical protein
MAPTLHSCFLERSRQQEASYPQFCLLQPVHAAASLRMLAASAGVSPTEHRRAAPTRAAAVGATHGGALHYPPRRQRVPDTSAAGGGALCGQACWQPLPVHVCALPSSCCVWCTAAVSVADHRCSRRRMERPRRSPAALLAGGSHDAAPPPGSGYPGSRWFLSPPSLGD